MTTLRPNLKPIRKEIRILRIPRATLAHLFEFVPYDLFEQFYQ